MGWVRECVDRRVVGYDGNIDFEMGGRWGYFGLVHIAWDLMSLFFVVYCRRFI